MDQTGQKEDDEGDSREKGLGIKISHLHTSTDHAYHDFMLNVIMTHM